jgi:hypothetical protein
MLTQAKKLSILELLALLVVDFFFYTLPTMQTQEKPK